MDFMKLILIVISSIFIFSHCTDDIQREPDREEIEDTREGFEAAERKTSRRNTRRRRSSSSGSSSKPYNPWHPYIARNPIDEDGDYILPMEKGGICIGNLLWLRENCDRLPSWLDQAESKGYEKVEIKSNGDVVWHWGVFLGTWVDGTWKGGTFFGKTWIDGTWEQGHWRHGTWEDGVWKSGSWENGEFLGGTWKSGYWCNGTWDGGTWKDGSWTNGVFESGTWKDGHWSYGEWRTDNAAWQTGSCSSTNTDGRSTRHNTEESPVDANSPCRNQLYEDFHNKDLQCD